MILNFAGTRVKTLQILLGVGEKIAELGKWGDGCIMS
jgi:hypothetical protein